MNYIKCPKCGKEEPAFDYAHVCGPVEVKKSFSKLLRQFEKESKLEIFGLGARRDIWEKALEKYAELIVRECMLQVEEQYKPVLEDKEMMKDTHWDGYVQCGVDSYVAIREHFYGVEE